MIENSEQKVAYSRYSILVMLYTSTQKIKNLKKTQKSGFCSQFFIFNYNSCLLRFTSHTIICSCLAFLYRYMYVYYLNRQILTAVSRKKKRLIYYSAAEYCVSITLLIINGNNCQQILTHRLVDNINFCSLSLATHTVNGCSV